MNQPMRKPPLGVMPYYLWEERYEAPTLLDLLQRYTAVANAVQCYREANLPPRIMWLLELGVVQPFTPPYR